MNDAGRVRRLQEVIARATAAPTPEQIAQVIVEEGVRALRGWIGALWLVEPEGHLELLRWTGVEPGRRFRRVALAGESPLALAVRTRTPVWIASRAEYVAAFPQSEQSVSDQPHEHEISCACLPLVAGGGAIGGLMFAFDTAREITDDERAFLLTIASQCAHAIERLRLLDQAHRLYALEAEARREAEAASRAKDEFLALLGHELRNPLAPIVTALTIMKLQPDGEHARQRAIIERQVDHLVRMVDDLLDVGRITRGAVELVRTPVALVSAVVEAVESAQNVIEERGHRITVDVSSQLVVDADPHRLAQVLTNLIVNAAKYTPDRGWISVVAQGDGGFARISIVDDGFGIAPDMLARVFEMFVQGTRTSDRAEGGLGLGLAVVRNLVERHGGRVEATSDGPGRGSTFTVWWPLAVGAVPMSAEERPPAAKSRSLRVLVVDDNVDAAATLGELLRALGHEPIVVHDAPSALTIARDETPELALVDLGLPILDGFELVERLRRLPGLAELPAVAVTGYGQARDRDRTSAAGFLRHVVKPVGLDDLRALLASLP